MADTALSLFRDMRSQGLQPDGQSYRRLFKCLRQACRFQDIVDIAAAVPDPALLVANDRIGVPLIGACLKVRREGGREGATLASCSNWFSDQVN